MLGSMTDYAEFVQIEKAWEANGSPWCEHSRVTAEFYLGARTGDRGCLDCGDTWQKGTEPVPRGVR